VAALVIALIGFLASLRIPHAPPSHPDIEVSFHLWRGSRDIILYALKRPKLTRTILSISWFLLIGAVFISQFANYAQSVVHADNQVYILFLTVFSIGVAAGSLLCDSLLKGEISSRFTSAAALGMSLFIVLMVAATPKADHAALMSVGEFLSRSENWLMLAAMMLVAVCGGLYMVPLYALLQHQAEAEYRSRVIAASNLSDSLCVTLATLAAALLLYVGAGITDLFLIIAVLNIGVAWYARKLA
jgi:acyl-[acyl-carrier-protein]-phospholipid O-acyltransferase/long-chain-fatty-acid--[acyl-carrier-protein] ligase